MGIGLHLKLAKAIFGLKPVERVLSVVIVEILGRQSANVRVFFSRNGQTKSTFKFQNGNFSCI